MLDVSRSMRLSAFVFVVLGFVCGFGAAPIGSGDGWSEPRKNTDGKVVQELKIEAPSFTEEDQYGYIMPERYRCDSCKATMFHLEAGLKKTHPKSRRMKQWEYTDAFDAICKDDFGGYGVKLINGENTLSGPGLKNDEQLTPGSGAIQMGGESWSKRLGEICRKLVYEEVGEEEIYDVMYKRLRGDGEAVDLGETLCKQELKQCQWRPQAGPRPPPVPDKKSSEVPKEKLVPDKAKAKAEKAKEKAAKDKSKADAAKAKAEKTKAKEKLEFSPATSPAAKSPRKGGEEVVDIQTFLRGLAVKHGLTSDEYLASRTVAEWERLSVAVAGRIFNKLATSEPDESCRAGAFGS